MKIAPAAERQLRKFDPPGRRRVQAAIDLLASGPPPPKAIQLIGGAGQWRVRTGGYRIIYEIHDDQLIVLSLRLGHRREGDVLVIGGVLHDAIEAPQHVDSQQHWD